MAFKGSSRRVWRGEKGMIFFDFILFGLGSGSWGVQSNEGDDL